MVVGPTDYGAGTLRDSRDAEKIPERRDTVAETIIRSSKDEWASVLPARIAAPSELSICAHVLDSRSDPIITPERFV
jgi:hypothetical protein